MHVSLDISDIHGKNRIVKIKIGLVELQGCKL